MRRLVLTGALCAGAWLSACQNPPQPPPTPTVVAPTPPPAPVPAAVAVPPSAPVDPVTDADRVARRLLNFQAHLATLDGPSVAAQIASLDRDLADTHSSAAPDVVLDLALALQRQHGPGDLARAAALLDALTSSAARESEPWQGMARLLSACIGDERRLEDLLEQEAVQRRDAQRSLQQTTEKLEALKAIERSMSSRGQSPRSP